MQVDCCSKQYEEQKTLQHFSVFVEEEEKKLKFVLYTYKTFITKILDIFYFKSKDMKPLLKALAEKKK